MQVPGGSSRMSMVDRDEMLDLLDELRAQLPVEIKRAQELLTARDKFVEDAKRDVDRMMRQAELDAKTKVSDSEVLYAAKEKARQMIARAEEPVPPALPGDQRVRRGRPGPDGGGGPDGPG